MKIEIVGFYEKERDDEQKKLVGSLHAYLIDEGIDIRGINVVKKKGRILIFLPHKVGIDEDSGKEVKYPVFTYASADKQKALKETIIRDGVEFVKKHLLEHPQKHNTEKKNISKDKSKYFTTRVKIPSKKMTYKVL